MQTNSLNMTPNEKAALGGDEDELNPQFHRLHVEHVGVRGENGSVAGRRGERMSLSGRALDDGEDLDLYGRSRRKESIASSMVGKMGVKLPQLPTFRFMKTRAEKEARKNMQRNRKCGESGSEEIQPKARGCGSFSEGNGKGLVEEEVPPWERVDFITALTDPDVEAQVGDGKKKKG